MFNIKIKLSHLLRMILPTAALPRASALFALATDNSLDCPLYASRPLRMYRTQVKMLSIRETELSHFDLAILYKTVYPLREAPSVAQKLCQFILPLQANAIMIVTSFSPLRTQRCLLNETRDYLLNSVFRNNLVLDNNHTKCVPRLFGRNKTEPRRRGVLHISRDTLTRSSPLRLQSRLRKRKSVDRLRFEQADANKFHFSTISHS